MRREALLNTCVAGALLALVALGVLLPRLLLVDYRPLAEEKRLDVQTLTDSTDTDTQTLKKTLAEDIGTLERRYASEVAAIDATALTRDALSHYKAIWNARKNREDGFAISDRERTLLKMMALAKDPTKAPRDIVEEIAREAAPQGADIAVLQGRGGMELSVDFDMNVLTHGEQGTRTKHETVDSLRTEVERLLGRVANDVYEHCKDLDLRRISFGCRHQVTTTARTPSRYSSWQPSRFSSKTENLILLKVALALREVGNVTHNPFLDSYSISTDFEKEVDNFDTITIEKERAYR